MCCNNGFHITFKSDPSLFSLFPFSTHQTRPDPPLFITFPTRFTRFKSIKPPKSSSSSTSTLNDTVMSEPSSFYDLLGIPETGTILEIKQAYKQLARKYHPDVSPPGRVEEYTQRFIRVQEAYETLSDPQSRQLYDKDMANGIHFAFSARKRYQNANEQMENKNEWRSSWQTQVSELKRRSVYKDTCNDMSWGARMRRQRNESSSS